MPQGGPSENTEIGGSGFTTQQNSLLDRVVMLIRSQNPCVGFTYDNAETVIPVGTFLKTQGIQTTIELGGWIPLVNGFLAGIGIVTHEQFAEGEGLQLRVHRNGVASACMFRITEYDNVINPSGNAGGAVRSRMFNTIPYERNPSVEDERDVFHYRAGEKITIATEAITLPRTATGTNPATVYADSDDIHTLIVWLYWVSEIPGQETLNAQNVGGGSPGDVPGGGGGGGGGPIIGM